MLSNIIRLGDNIIVTDLIMAVVQLLRRDINGLVETALGELELVELWDKG